MYHRGASRPVDTPTRAASGIAVPVGQSGVPESITVDTPLRTASGIAGPVPEGRTIHQGAGRLLHMHAGRQEADAGSGAGAATVAFFGPDNDDRPRSDSRCNPRTRAREAHLFSKAVPIAHGFTRPLVLSSRTVQGECQSTIGAYVVVNAGGWILTAGHLLEIVRQQQESVRRHQGFRSNVVEFQRDTVADKRFRKKGVRTFERPATVSVRNHSVWWGIDDAHLVEAKMLPEADLALGRLEPFDPASVPQYPVFKDPGGDYMPGRSLCKLGFPFHRIVPVYDEEADAFTLPPGSVPLPMFPLDGMFTRIVNTRAPGSGAGKPSAFIETSSPSLIGQMGGPVFDAEARVWGIQSHTMHHPLGFHPPAPGGGPGQVEHQFLNMGLAVHASVIRRFLDSEGIAHRSG